MTGWWITIGALALATVLNTLPRILIWKTLPRPKAYEVGMILISPFGNRVRIVGTDNSPVDGRCRGFWAKDEKNSRIYIGLIPGSYWRLPL